MLGSAQLGVDYGVANAGGCPPTAEAAELVNSLWSAGVRWFDTAQAYGESETVLGQCLGEAGRSEQAQVVTKLLPEVGLDGAPAISTAVGNSVARLGVPRLAGLMFHHESVLDEWAAWNNSLLELKASGLVERLGVSVYSPQAAFKALRLGGIDMIQFPANMLDHRFRQSGVVEAALNAGKMLFVRSIYLQGLFFATEQDFCRRSDRLHYLDTTRALFWIRELNQLSGELAIPLDALGLAYVRDAYPEAQVIIGMESVAQARRNLEAWKTVLPEGFVEAVGERFSAVESEIVHPPYWRRGRLT